MKIDDNFYMKLAIDEAWKYQLLTYPNPAVGCVVVKDGELLSIEAHKEAGKPHAEVNALKAAYLKKHPNDRLKTINDAFKIHEYLLANHNNFFHNCEVYVTLEPCNHVGKTPACANLLKALNPQRVIVAHEDVNPDAIGGIKTLEDEGVNVDVGCMKKEAYDLLYPFIKWSQGTFIFYKMAQTLNGSIDGAVSSKQALAYVHALRDKIDCMAIGGNTVREDRPTLDARYIAGRAPNIFIYSKNQIFDKTIPLFGVPNRDVIISDDLFKLTNYNFVMVEGVYNLMELLKERIDYILLLVSPKIRNGLNSMVEINQEYEIIHENYIGKEKIIYLKRVTA